MTSRRRVSATAMIAATALVACAEEFPPGLGDQTTDSRLEVVQPADSDWSIGKELRLSELEGKPIVLDFWASWCGPCRLQHSFITELKEKYGDEIHDRPGLPGAAADRR